MEYIIRRIPPRAARRLRWARRPALILLLVWLTLTVGAAQYRTIERVSVTSAGAQANGPSTHPVISADGRYIAFLSAADNLGGPQTFTFVDAYRHDRQTGVTTLITRGLNGAEANGDSSDLSISADGRFIVFTSDASNLVADDTNGVSDVFLYDAQTQAITRLSVTADGQQLTEFSGTPSISADGAFVAFTSRAPNLVAGDTNGTTDIFVRDLQTSTLERVSQNSGGEGANQASFNPVISADGNVVVFETSASNLMPGTPEGITQIYAYIRSADVILRVSASSAGTAGDGASFSPSLSADGRYVVFESLATNLVPGDTNGLRDIFRFDRQTSTIERVNVSSSGAQTEGGISRAARISGSGRYVVFQSASATLVADDTNNSTDIFVRDMATSQTTRVSVSSAGVAGDANSTNPAINVSAGADDGLYIAFQSAAANLVPGDTNGATDIFVAERLSGSAPGTPALTAAPNGQTSITLTWGDVEGEDSYRAEWSSDGLTGWTTLATLPANATTVTDSGLVCQTTRHYRLIAINLIGEAFSNVANATTADCPLPPEELLVNGGFERNNKNNQPAGWTHSNLTQERSRCNTVSTTFARSGNCAYFFRGSPQENSALAQDIRLTGLNLAAGDTLTLSAYMRANRPTVKFNLIVRVLYSGGVPESRQVLRAQQSGEYVLYEGTVVVQSAQVRRIIVRLVHRSPGGWVYVDDVSLLLRRGEPGAVLATLRGQ